jgi:hypothetical protein
MTDTTMDEAIREAVDQHLRNRFAYHVPMDYLTLVRRLLQSDHTYELYKRVKEEMHERDERTAYNDTYNDGSVGDKAYAHGYDDGWNRARDEVLLLLDGHMQWLREQ